MNDVLHFSAVIESINSKNMLRLPSRMGDNLTGLDRVEGTINGQPFRARLVRFGLQKSYIAVNQAMLNGARADVGSRVEVFLLNKEKPLVIPVDFASRLNGSSEAKDSWSTLSDLQQRDWVRWIDDTNNSETRLRRIDRALDQLAEGKRRACCVNVNKFMLCKINEYQKSSE